jgi:hypothetical protein
MQVCCLWAALHMYSICSRRTCAIVDWKPADGWQKTSAATCPFLACLQNLTWQRCDTGALGRVPAAGPAVAGMQYCRVWRQYVVSLGNMWFDGSVATYLQLKPRRSQFFVPLQ